MTNVHLFKVEKSVLKQQNEKSNHYQTVFSNWVEKQEET